MRCADCKHYDDGFELCLMGEDEEDDYCEWYEEARYEEDGEHGQM